MTLWTAMMASLNFVGYVGFFLEGLFYMYILTERNIRVSDQQQWGGGSGDGDADGDQPTTYAHSVPRS